MNRKEFRENFKKLNQLDRIELRLRMNELDRKHEGSSVYSFLWPFLGLSAFILIMAAIFYNIDRTVTTGLTLGLARLFEIAAAIIALLLILDLVDIFVYRKQRNEILKDYFIFKTEIKKGEIRGKDGRK